MSEHSPEPWRVDGGYLKMDACVIAANDTFVLGYSSDEGAFSEDDPNIVRIVACVNAMEGIPDPQAFVEAARAIVKADEENHAFNVIDLQAALKESP